MVLAKDKSYARKPTRWMPDIVVGIDFGCVGTAVAFSHGPHWPEPELITSWPGRDGDVLATKVPSRISYYKNDANRVKSWGFGCDYDKQDEDVKKSFKAALDPDHYIQAPEHPGLRAACRYTVDFLRCLYEHTCSHLASFSLKSPDRKVEFLFSVPSPWINSGTQDRFRALVATAGFTKQPQHRINIEVSEAEASAISAVPQDAETRAAVLLCHTGALFTELTLLSMVPLADAGYTFKTNAYTKAKAIGSARIDYEFHELIKTGLSSMNQVKTNDYDSLIRKMMQGRYRTYKHSFDSEEPVFLAMDLAIPNSRHEIERFGTNKLSQDEFSVQEEDFRALFDQQLELLIEFIEQELSSIRGQVTGPDVTLVMSGGFSDNPYLRKRLEVWKSVNRIARRGYNVTVAFTDDGKLQVVQGLIMQHIRSQKPSHHLLSPLGYDREIWGAIIRKFETINSTSSFGQVEDALNEDMPMLSSQFRNLQKLYSTALPMLNWEERAYIDKAFKDTDRSVRKIYKAPELNWMESALSLPQHRTLESKAADLADLPRLVHQTLQVLQHLGVVAEFLQEVLETRSKIGTSSRYETRGNDLEKGTTTIAPGKKNRSIVTTDEAQCRSAGTSRASSIVTTRTKLSTTTTLEEDQRSLDLTISGTPFHIARDGSSVTSGNDLNYAPPPYSPAAV